jgi:ATP-dependent Clp protease adaptor protein ClpS
MTAAGTLTETAAPTVEEVPREKEAVTPDRPWLVIVWNDPINLMTYVTYVFQRLFGYSKAKAERLMLDVHLKGRAVVTSGPRERAEADVTRLHRFGLWATLEQAP